MKSKYFIFQYKLHGGEEQTLTIFRVCVEVESRLTPVIL